MMNALRHRGPDGEGSWFSDDATVALGHRRLAILDLSEQGSQPMHSLDGRYCIVYNGELYNYRELRKEHVQRGIRYHGQSDTEVVLNHFALLGSKALTDFDGMFAFAIWDKAKRELFCARDRFGEKPFYYCYEKGRRFVFASEIKALLAAGVHRRIDHRMLYSYFRNPAFPRVADAPDGTYYEGVLKLPSATFLRISNDVIRTSERYWVLDPSKESSDLSFEDAREEFKRLFFQSIGRRLRSDVPIGSSLSGGIDSSAIVCAISLLTPRAHYNTFSARFTGFESDEGEFIDQVNRKTGAIPNSVQPSASDMMRDLKEMSYFQDEPVESASAFGQWSVMRLVKDRGVVVLLDGQGGDEIAAGYHEYFPAYLADLLKRDPRAATEESAAILDRLRLDVRPSVAEGELGAANILLRGSLRIKRNARRLLAMTRAGRFIPATTFLSRSYHWEYGHDELLTRKQPPTTLNGALHNDLIDGKLEHYLRYADRNSMAHSREVRLPFLYHELVEFMFSLPARYKIRHGWTKYLIREALKGIVPEQVLWRKEKIGFAIPQAQWMSDTRVRPIVRESHDYLVREGIVNKQWPDSGAQSWEMMMAYLLLTGGESSVGWGGAEAGSFAGSTRLPSSIAGGVSTA